MWILLVTFLLRPGPGSGVQPSTDPDALYRDRANLPSAIAAAAIWEQRTVDDSRDFESAWKLARAAYWLGGHVETGRRRAEYERGLAAARLAIALEPARPEGHFWLAADMGAMAESLGLLAGIRYRGSIKRELETVLRLDPAFQQGSADRALGRWYDKVPGLFGGSNAKAVEHLRRSLTYDAGSAASHFFLAEVMLDMNRRAEARDELQRVLDAPLDPEWLPEVTEFRRKASALLEALR